MLDKSVWQFVVHYCEFPPLTNYVSHAAFSWFFFWGLMILGFSVFCLLFYQLQHKSSSVVLTTQRTTTIFPWWGYMGLALIGVSWVLAWNRFSFFQILQPHTFLPLWLGFILSINGLTYKRTGSCLLINRTVYFLTLFPVSACFWWFFEYLNRFVQNWYYVGIDDFSIMAYSTPLFAFRQCCQLFLVQKSY